MKIGAKVSEIPPLLRSLGRPDVSTHDEYRISLAKSPAAFSDLTTVAMDQSSQHEFLPENVVVWVSPHCFIMQASLSLS
jgi:hypothetical protein